MGELRERLDDLGLRRQRGVCPPADRPSANHPPADRPPIAATAPTPGADLAGLIGGGESVCEDAACWRLDAPSNAVLPALDVAPADFQTSRRYARDGAAAIEIDPRRALLIDVETAGLAGSPVLLIGVVALDAWPLTVRQWLARDFHEERALLLHLRDWLGPRDTWISFNGKSFDEPLIRERSLVCRVELPSAAIHLDLLHVARRRWRGELPDCKLKTLEAHILGRQRVGDPPSCDVPDLFLHFFRTGRPGPLRPVLTHNQIDLLSCAELLVRTTEPVSTAISR